jgi:hypothetical protein
MPLSRFVGFVDLGVATVVLVTLVLPAREMYASAVDAGDEAERFGLALAEARTMAHPDDGAAIAELSRRLGAARENDWAIEVAVHGGERARQSPSRWRALLAASVAFVDRRDVVPGLDYANRALSSCDDHAAGCPSWERLRMSMYREALDAGVAAGIDPRRGPAAAEAFRRAGERAVRPIHVGGRDAGGGAATPPSAPSSGAGSAGDHP